MVERIGMFCMLHLTGQNLYRIFGKDVSSCQTGTQRVVCHRWWMVCNYGDKLFLEIMTVTVKYKLYMHIIVGFFYLLKDKDFQEA